jgi:hypothetical protein
MVRTIAHIINVTELTEANRASYLHVAQPVTMKSMALARRLACDLVEVELWAIKHKSECVEIHEDFKWANPIERYAHECILSLRDEYPRRPLPLIKDILLGLYETSNAEYFVYTNLDIGLYPDFYLKVDALIRDGYDGLCINRLTLPKVYQGVVLDAASLELAFMAEGERHSGSDCFVFRREIVPSLNLGNVFIGFPPVGKVLRGQIELCSKRFLWVKEMRCTFHLGDDLAWKSSSSQYAAENRKQAAGLYERRRDE